MICFFFWEEKRGVRWSVKKLFSKTRENTFFETGSLARKITKYLPRDRQVARAKTPLARGRDGKASPPSFRGGRNRTVASPPPRSRTRGGGARASATDRCGHENAGRVLLARRACISLRAARRARDRAIARAQSVRKRRQARFFGSALRSKLGGGAHLGVGILGLDEELDALDGRGRGLGDGAGDAALRRRGLEEEEARGSARARTRRAESV
jgi:hypothetical protein